MTKAVVLDAEPVQRTSSGEARRRPDQKLIAERLELDVSQCVVELTHPLDAMGAALDRGDDNAIWRMFRNSRDSAAFLDWLGSMATSAIYPARHPRDPSRQSPWNHSLFLVPVVYTSSELAGGQPEEVDRLVFEQMRADLEDWFGRKTAVSLYGSLVRYREISQWGPSAVRAALAHFRGAGDGWPQARAEQLPQVAVPALEFVVGCAHRWLAYPELPEVARGGDVAILERLRGRLTLLGPEGHVPDLLLPDFFCEAVWSGLSLWVGLLANRLQASRFQVDPAGEDRVRLNLQGEEGDLLATVPLRQYQLGLGGLDLLISELLAMNLCLAPAAITAQ